MEEPLRGGPLRELPLLLLFPLRGRLPLERLPLLERGPPPVRGRSSRRSFRESLEPSVDLPPRAGAGAPATEPRGLVRTLLRR